MRRVAALTLVALIAVACSNDSKDKTAPKSITGVVVQVKMEGLTKVDYFTVRRHDKTYKIFIDPDTDLGFPPSHLNEHRVTGQPVVVQADERDGRLYATSVGDG